MRYRIIMVIGLLGIILLGCTKTKTHYGTGYYAPCWNADGTRIYYFRNDLTVKKIEKMLISSTYEYEKNEWYICSCDLEGGDRKELVEVLEFKGENESYWGYVSLDYSSTEDKLIYSLSQSQFGIWIINADGTEKEKISSTGRNPKWRPNGGEICYNEESEGIWLMDANGNNKHEIFEKGTSPSWSPLDNWIVFDENQFVNGSAYGEKGILRINRDTEDTIRISQKGNNPVYSSDARQLA